MELLSDLFVRLLRNCDENGFVEIQNNNYLQIDGGISLTHEEVAVLASLGVTVCDFDH